MVTLGKRRNQRRRNFERILCVYARRVCKSQCYKSKQGLFLCLFVGFKKSSKTTGRNTHGKKALVETWLIVIVEERPFVKRIEKLHRAPSRGRQDLFPCLCSPLGHPLLPCPVTRHPSAIFLKNKTPALVTSHRSSSSSSSLLERATWCPVWPSPARRCRYSRCRRAGSTRSSARTSSSRRSGPRWP